MPLRPSLPALGFLLMAALPAAPPVAAEDGQRAALERQLVAIPGGAFRMGDAGGEPDEAPREASVGPFRIMDREVTRAQFAAFAAESGHVSDPERRGFGFVWTTRWRRQPGADWRRPEGAAPALPETERHPVVQVSARDAEAFCAHYGLRLPTDEEWELAARGFDGRRYPWGDTPPFAPGQPRRGNFGSEACCAPDAGDGFLGTAPVGRYPAGRSPFGLWDMAGNVWEWTASRRPDRPDLVILRGGGWGNNPYCLRVSYRHDNPADIGLNMVGFRCAADPS